MMTKLYHERDIEEQGEAYTKHLVAMSQEQLHSKSDIAAELAHRDLIIGRLEAQLREAGERPKRSDFNLELQADSIIGLGIIEARNKKAYGSLFEYPMPKTTREIFSQSRIDGGDVDFVFDCMGRVHSLVLYGTTDETRVTSIKLGCQENLIQGSIPGRFFSDSDLKETLDFIRRRGLPVGTEVEPFLETLKNYLWPFFNHSRFISIPTAQMGQILRFKIDGPCDRVQLMVDTIRDY